MQQYLYNTPQVLTDEIFTLYGGQTGTSSVLQREIAYTLAEEQMVEHIHSYITPTHVTGTFLWRGSNPVLLDYGWIISVGTVSLNSVDASRDCLATIHTGCYAVRNAQYGILDVAAGCSGLPWMPPYSIQVSYESGLSTGAYTSKSMLMALTIAAQINLNEIDVSLSNESIADVGIEYFINQKYHEKRIKGINTAFGNSAMANRAALLSKKFRARPSIGIR